MFFLYFEQNFAFGLKPLMIVLVFWYLTFQTILDLDQEQFPSMYDIFDCTHQSKNCTYYLILWKMILSALLAWNYFLALKPVTILYCYLKILQVPASFLLPGVAMISFVGIYSLSGSYFDLLLMIGFGVLGFTLRKLRIPAVPVILGILLGSHMEVSLRRAMVLSNGDWTYLFDSYISVGLWIAALVGFVAPIFLRSYLKKPTPIGE